MSYLHANKGAKLGIPVTNIGGDIGLTTKNINITPYIGFDYRFDNALVGGFFGYSHTKSKTDSVLNFEDIPKEVAKNGVDTTRKAFNLGLFFANKFDNNELTLKTYYGQGDLDIKPRRLSEVAQQFVNNHFISGSITQKYFMLGLDYGKIYEAENFQIKPMVSLYYSNETVAGVDAYLKNIPIGHAKLSDNVGLTFNRLNLGVGVDFRTYMNDGSYYYVNPKLDFDLINNFDKIDFTGGGLEMKGSRYMPTFSLKAGADYKLSKNSGINFGAGFAIDDKHKYLNTNVALHYDF